MSAHRQAKRTEKSPEYLRFLHYIRIEQKIIEKARTDEQFKKDLIENPKKVLNGEFDFEIPDSISVEVLEEKPDKLYLVLPMHNEDAEIPDDMLDKVAGGVIRFGDDGT